MNDRSILIQQNESRIQEIEEEIKNQPLTSDLRPISDLEKHYGSAQGASSRFLLGVTLLQENKYTMIRMVRGDGNCFYRAFLYGLVENIRTDKSECQRVVEFFKEKSWNDALEQGYQEMTLETFYDVMVDLLQRVSTGQLDRAEFHREMCEENGTSDYCTWYLRVITATYLKKDPDRFLPFLLDAQQSAGEMFLDMAQFCQRHVEPMGQECEQIQIVALAEAVGVCVNIEYLDGRHENNRLISHKFGPSGAAVQLNLLYRPGHYDILYRKQD